MLNFDKGVKQLKAHHDVQGVSSEIFDNEMANEGQIELQKKIAVKLQEIDKKIECEFCK